MVGARGAPPLDPTTLCTSGAERLGEVGDSRCAITCVGATEPPYLIYLLHPCGAEKDYDRRPIMRPRLLAPVLVLFLTACTTPASRVPPFAARPYEPFVRTNAVAIALREWRLFGSPIDDPSLEGWEAGSPLDKPERAPGLWQRVGEYWWLGQNADEAASAWNGKHDRRGDVFPVTDDERYAWSAAFISYVMRIAGAGDRFPYSPNHATYVNAAAAGRSPILRAEPPESYAPKPGDLICRGRYGAADLTFRDLPTSYIWPGHCGIVVSSGPGTLDIVGGNVEDAVRLTHVPLTARGTLGDPGEPVLDQRYRWFVVLRVLYDAEVEPPADE
jgi:hypothetical protein